MFRGSTPSSSPYTKDIVYSRGFILVYNFIHLAVKKGMPDHIRLLFSGKTTVDDRNRSAVSLRRPSWPTPVFEGTRPSTR